VTKSGSNVFHGSVFEFLRNDVFDARNFFAPSKETLERNQFGGTLGGRLFIPGMYDGRSRTFFFASYEGQRRRQGNVNVAVVPTAAERAGDFRGLAPIYDPGTTVANPSGSGPAWSLAGALTSILGPSMVHEVRFSRMYGEYRSTAYFQGEGVDLVRQAGITGLEGIQDRSIASLPAFSFSGYQGFSGNAGDGR